MKQLLTVFLFWTAVTFPYYFTRAYAMELLDKKTDQVQGRIVFGSDREGGGIYLLERGEIKKVSIGGLPKFSADGKKIFYGGQPIYEYDIQSRKTKKLINLKKYGGSHFEISSDQKQVLFLSEGNPTERNDPYNIFTINMDGTNLTQITFFEGRGSGYSTAGPEYPRWSPDGKWIAFEGPPTGLKEQFSDTLYIMKSDGTDIKKLIGPESMAAFAEFNWSLDSKSIAFTAIKEPAKPDGTPGSPRHIFIIDIDGSNLRQVTSGIYPCQHPDFSPDGRQIVYSSRRHPNQNIMGFGISGAELFVSNLDGTNEHRITPPQVVSRSGLGIFPWDKIYATDTSPDWA